MTISNCFICDTLVPELEHQLDKAKERIRELKMATDAEHPAARSRFLQLMDENTHLKREIAKSQQQISKAIQLLGIAIDEGKTWDEEFRLKFLKQVADYKRDNV